jgi:hypothetical protein
MRPCINPTLCNNIEKKIYITLIKYGGKRILIFLITFPISHHLKLYFIHDQNCWFATQIESKKKLKKRTSDTYVAPC